MTVPTRATPSLAAPRQSFHDSPPPITARLSSRRSMPRAESVGSMTARAPHRRSVWGAAGKTPRKQKVLDAMARLPAASLHTAISTMLLPASFPLEWAK